MKRPNPGRTILVLGMLFIAMDTFPQTVLKMTVLEDRMREYRLFLDEKGKKVEEITDLSSKYASRNVADIVIICQALKEGGYPVVPEFVVAPNYAREMALVQSGMATIMHQTAWSADFTDQAYQSPIVIDKGKFVKGLYAAAEKAGQYKIAGITDLKELTCVSSDTWNIDWATLRQIGLKSMESTARKESMLKMVLLRNIDFTLQEFTVEPDLAYNTPEGKLLPIPGFKLALDDTRSFMVSRGTPDGKMVADALAKGIGILKARGTIEKYYTDCGFYRSDLSSWKTLMVNTRPER